MTYQKQPTKRTGPTSEHNYNGALGIAFVAIVHLRCGEAVTDSLIIAREFGRKHGNVLQSLAKLALEGTISRLDFKPSNYLDERGKTRRKVELTERGALIAMPFIGGKHSRVGQQRLVDAFLTMRTEFGRQKECWDEARNRSASGFLIMCEAVRETRTDQGKKTSAYHYANEAKLINWVMFGQFESVDLNRVTQSELDLRDQVERRNAFLIMRGRTYNERKQMLPSFLLGLRTKRLKVLQ